MGNMGNEIKLNKILIMSFINKQKYKISTNATHHPIRCVSLQLNHYYIK